MTMTFRQIQRQEKVKKLSFNYLPRLIDPIKYFIQIFPCGLRWTVICPHLWWFFYTVYIKQHASLQVHIFGGGVSNKVFCVNASADVWPNVKKLCEPDWCPLWDWIRGLWLWTPCPRLSEHRGPQANHHCTAPITRAAAVIIGFFLHFYCVQT